MTAQYLKVAYFGRRLTGGNITYMSLGPYHVQICSFSMVLHQVPAEHNSKGLNFAGIGPHRTLINSMREAIQRSLFFGVYNSVVNEKTSSSSSWLLRQITTTNGVFFIRDFFVRNGVIKPPTTTARDVAVLHILIVTHRGYVTHHFTSFIEY
mmetsp:Transcript_62246/g.151756  ORF Transcript_62246/g.151756 Transcript_62246/m.151756 type:complete len:152 (+) Transcript_62246:1260-1715(+)